MERWELPATRNTCRHSYVYSSLLNFKKSNKDDDKGKRRQIYNAMPFVSHYFSNARLFGKRCLSRVNSSFNTFTSSLKFYIYFIFIFIIPPRIISIARIDFQRLELKTCMYARMYSQRRRSSRRVKNLRNFTFFNKLFSQIQNSVS